MTRRSAEMPSTLRSLKKCSSRHFHAPHCRRARKRELLSETSLLFGKARRPTETSSNLSSFDFSFLLRLFRRGGGNPTRLFCQLFHFHSTTDLPFLLGGWKGPYYNPFGRSRFVASRNKFDKPQIENSGKLRYSVAVIPVTNHFRKSEPAPDPIPARGRPLAIPRPPDDQQVFPPAAVFRTVSPSVPC